ncbi:putative transcription factor MYB-HB-like family [Helianthus debilis subsp. tardiflorus]
MVRPACCDKIDMKKGSWNEEDDAQMLAFVTKQPTSSWQVGAPRKPGLRRCAKSCRLRKTNITRNDEVRHENFTPQEEELIIKLHSAIGSRWPIIAQQLPGRTDNDVKNYWNTKLKKKLSSMGIDPVTHRPFSQMLADYGNISGLTRTKTKIGSLGRDTKNTFFITSQDQTQQLPTTGHLFPTFNNDVKMEPPEAIKTDSLDLLTQLQAITHGKDSSTTHDQTSFTQFHVSVAASCSSSSSSSCSTLNEMTAQPTFNWRDFLIENAGNDDQKLNFEEVGGVDEVVKGDTSLINGVTETMEDGCDESFVEAMLDGEDDMFLDFPGLLG